MPAFQDLTGKVFGRLTVLERAENNRDKNVKYRCRCKCGNERVVYRNALATGKTKSCGCLNREKMIERATTHGYTRGGKKTPEYTAINNIINRCCNQNHPEYPDYGGRGITVCDRWKNNLGLFVKDMGERPSKMHSIERVDNDKGYYPENCVWADKTQQSRNQRPFKRSTTGVRGVVWDVDNYKYRAYIHIKRKAIHLGRFNTLEEATDARRKAELKYWGKSSI